MGRGREATAFKKGNQVAVGNRGRSNPSLLTQTLISQLNEVDENTGAEKKHLLCAKLIQLGLAGDVHAIHEIFDRVQGRAPQAVSIDAKIAVSYQEAVQRAFKILDLDPSKVPARLTSLEEDQGPGEDED
jgi:hypothetical protein